MHVTTRDKHRTKDFLPISRFCKNELSTAIEKMERLLKEEDEKGASTDVVT